MNKRGKTRTNPTIIFVALGMVVLIGLIAYMIFGVLPQQVAPTPAGVPTVTPEDCGTVRLFGKASTVHTNIYDRASSTPNTAIRSPYYIVSKENGAFLVDGSASSASSRTATSTSVGKVLRGIAFNGTYYGVWNEFCVDKEQVDLDLEAYKIAQGIEITLKGNDSVSDAITDVYGGTANFVATIEKIEIKSNDTYKVFDLAGIYMDTVAETNVSTVTMGTPALSVTKNSIVPRYGIEFPAASTIVLDPVNIRFERVKSKTDFVWEITTPVRMFQSDKVVFGQIQITFDGDGVGTDEVMGIYAFDKQHYRSVKENAVLYGVETDAASPADVGSGDQYEALTCTAD
jgi:hypothetical protein